MRWPSSVRAAFAAAYPWLLASILIIFVWQAVAARHDAPVAAPPEDAAELVCSTVAQGVALNAIPEASGLALSVRSPGIVWSINDSSLPVLFRIDAATGRVVGSVRVTDADVNNWEDVTVAPCDGGMCAYVADGGNGGGTQRNDVVVYRVPDPTPDETRTPSAQSFHVAYPADEDHESEALFVAEGQLYLVTKGHPSLVFRFPRRVDSETLATLEQVGQVPTEFFLKTAVPRQTRITDAEASPSGRWVAMRTNRALLVYRASDVVAGRFGTLSHFDLSPLAEPQGEGVAISDEGDVYLASEGGGQGAPGLFSHLKCALPQ